MKGRYEIKPLVNEFLGIPVIRYGIFNKQAGISGLWVTDDSNEIWIAPRWILRRWIKLHEKIEDEK
jgi:hypothetical protein